MLSPEDVDTWVECYGLTTSFLHEEAELLDDLELSAWLELLSDDIEYRIPVRTTTARDRDAEFSDRSYHMNEDRSSLQARVDRLTTEYDWSEDPPSRTRRFVSNVRVGDHESGRIEATSNLLLYRSRGDTTSYDLVTGERHDVLREEEGEWKLLHRTVLLDQTIMGTHNLAVLL